MVYIKSCKGIFHSFARRMAFCFMSLAFSQEFIVLLKGEGDETRPRGCKYPTPPCTLAKILPETTVRAQFRQIENASPTTNTFLSFSTN